MALDDAGRPVLLLNPQGFCDWPMRGDARIAALVRRAATVGGVWSKRAVFEWAAMGVGFVVMVVGLQWLLSQLWPGARWMNQVAMVAVAFGGGRWWWRARLAWKADAAKRVILAEGLCAACGYNLHGLGALARPEGLLHCPECGAAWNRWRVDRTAPFADGATFGNPLPTIGSQHGGGGWGTWTARDAYEDVVPLVHPRLVKLWAPGPGSPAWAGKLRAARREIVHANRWSRRSALAFIWLLPIGTAAMFAWTMRSPVNQTAGTVAMATVFSGVMLALALWATFGNFCYSHASVRRAMLANGLCASCGGELHAANADENGIVTCEGCRAGWRP